MCVRLVLVRSLMLSTHSTSCKNGWVTTHFLQRNQIPTLLKPRQWMESSIYMRPPPRAFLSPKKKRSGRLRGALISKKKRARGDFGALLSRKKQRARGRKDAPGRMQPESLRQYVVRPVYEHFPAT